MIKLCPRFPVNYCLSIESIRLGGPVHGTVTKTLHISLLGGGGGAGGGWVGE